MSIEVTGPKAYEFQYILSLYIALKSLQSSTSNINCYIEKIGKEDAELIIDSAGEVVSIEIQIKSTSGDIDEKKLANWLCHYEGKSFKNSILQRLLQQRNKQFLLATSGRCLDITKDFVSIEQKLKNNHSFNKENILKILNAIILQDKDGKTKLKKERNKTNQILGKELKDKESNWQSLFKKIVIWENLKEESIKYEIKNILNQYFKIPQLETQNVVLKLLQIITEKGRNNQEDIIPLILKTLNDLKGAAPNLNNISYITRENEDFLISELISKKYLLLNGSSLCGKSQTAKQLSLYFYNLGYRYLHTDNLSEATRFINDINVDENRICLLEDPFGHQIDDQNINESWLKVQNLLHNIPIGRLLIITSNERVTDFLNKSIYGQQWINLTVKEKSFAEKIWKQISSDKNLPEPISSKIFIYLNSETIMPQPGHLIYLANNYVELKDFTIEGIRHFYMIDAERISDQVKLKGVCCEEIFRVLGLISSFIIPANRELIAYILNDDIEVLGLLKSNHLGVSMFGDDDVEEEKSSFPEYPKNLLIPEKYQSELDELQNKGYILFNSITDTYIFSHPIFYEAAKQLMKKLPIGKFEKFCKILLKAIGSLSINNSIETGRRFRFLFTEYSNQVVFREKIILTAESGLSSTFPAINDICLSFLSQVIEYLPENINEKIKSEFANATGDIAYIFWNDGIPFIPQKGVISGYRFDANRSILSNKEFKTLIEKFESRESEMTSEIAWKVANYIESKSLINPIKIDEIILLRLMNFNEAFIREVASYHMMWLYTNPNLKLIERAFEDEHPSVVFEAIKGCFRGWFRYTSATKNKLNEFINKVFPREDIILRSTHFMTQFGIGYSGNSFDWRDHIQEKAVPSMWKLWGDLLPIFFEHLPVHIGFHHPRFAATMQNSVKFIKEDQVPGIVSAWHNWLNKYIKEKGSDGFLFEVTEYLFSFEFIDLKSRESASIPLILNTNPYFSASNFRVFAENWNILTENEKSSIIIRLKADPILLAVFLTAEIVPDIIIEEFIKEPQDFRDGTKKVTEVMSDYLLNICIAVKYIAPYYSHLKFSSDKLWHNILEYYLDKNHSLFSNVAIQNLFEESLFYSPTDKKLWKDPLIKFNNVIKIAKPNTIEFVFDLLLEHLTNFSSSSCDDYLNCLFAETEVKYHEKWKKRIIENIESIDNRDNLEIIDKLFEKSIFEDLKEDYIICAAVQLAERNELIGSEFTSPIITTIKGINEQNLIRLSLTYEMAKKWIQKVDSSNISILESLEINRRKRVEIGFEQNEALSTKLNSYFEVFRIENDESKFEY